MNQGEEARGFTKKSIYMCVCVCICAKDVCNVCAGAEVVRKEACEIQAIRYIHIYMCIPPPKKPKYWTSTFPLCIAMTQALTWHVQNQKKPQKLVRTYIHTQRWLKKGQGKKIRFVSTIIMLHPLALRACGASTQCYVQGKPCLPGKNPCSDRPIRIVLSG